jgi:hypothetical protein
MAAAAAFEAGLKPPFPEARQKQRQISPLLRFVEKWQNK